MLPSTFQPQATGNTYAQYKVVTVILTVYPKRPGRRRGECDKAVIHLLPGVQVHPPSTFFQCCGNEPWCQQLGHPHCLFPAFCCIHDLIGRHSRGLPTVWSTHIRKTKLTLGFCRKEPLSSWTAQKMQMARTCSFFVAGLVVALFLGNCYAQCDEEALETAG